MAITVLLVEGHEILRQGIAVLLEQEADIEVIGEVGDGGQALGVVVRLCPDVVIMDVTMPNLNGLDTTRKIVWQLPSTRVIALSLDSDRHFVEDAFRAGASAYLHKECLSDELVRAIRKVLDGETYLSPSAASGILGHCPKGVSLNSSGLRAAPTERERKGL